MSPDLASAVSLARDAFAIPAHSGVLLGGGATANRCFALADGAGRPRWVLRCPQRDTRPARLGFLLGFHRAARAQGLPIAAPKRTVDGHEWADDGHGRPWALLDYLPGRPLAQVTTQLAAQAAIELASLHRLPEQLAIEVPAVGPDSAWDAWLSAPEQTWRAAADLASAHQSLLAGYRIHLEQLHTHAAGLGQLAATVWGHGDFHGHNLLHHRGQITGVLDLDGLGRRPRTMDVAYAVLMLARTGSGDYRLRPPLIHAVLSRYRQHATATLTPAEAAALWPAMVLSQLPDPGHLAALRRAGHPLGPALARPLAALRDLAAQRTRLNDLLAEAAPR